MMFEILFKIASALCATKCNDKGKKLAHCSDKDQFSLKRTISSLTPTYVYQRQQLSMCEVGQVLDYTLMNFHYFCLVFYICMKFFELH